MGGGYMGRLSRILSVLVLALAATAASAQSRFSLFHRAYAPGTIGTMYYTSATAGDIAAVVPGTANECLTFAAAPSWGSCLTAVSGAEIALVPGPNNNIAIGERSLVRFTCTTGPSCNITGIAGGTDGRVLLVNGVASGGSYIGIDHEEATSTSTNRITTATGADIASSTLDKRTNAVLVYEGATSRWVVIEDERIAQIAGSSKYTTIQDEGSALTQRTVLNFIGAGVTCADGSGKTNCTIPGALGDTQVFIEDGTWTKPAGARVVSVSCVGGGGAGGGGTASYASSRRGGTGGGGGARVERTFAADSLGATEAVTIGAGGVGGTGRVNNATFTVTATPGGVSAFGTHLTAYGGGAGAELTDGAAINSGSGGGGAYGAGSNTTNSATTLGGLPAKTGEYTTAAVGTAGASSYGLDANTIIPQAAEWGGGAGGGEKSDTLSNGTRDGGRSMFGAGGGGGGAALNGNFNNRTNGTVGAGGAPGAYSGAGGGGAAGGATDGANGAAGAAGGLSRSGSGGGGGASGGFGTDTTTGFTGGIGGAGGVPGGGGGGGGGGHRNVGDTAGLGGNGGAGARGECVVISW